MSKKLCSIGLSAAIAILSVGRVLGAVIGPDSPRDQFWQRSGTGRGLQAEAMNPKLEEMARAFGLARYGEVERLAADTLKAAKDPGLVQETAALLVESHLGQGEFAQARAAVNALLSLSPETTTRMLARIDSAETGYQAAVGRLQAASAGAVTAWEAAEAALRTARLHELTGLASLAEESYKAVITQYPTEREAGRALSQLLRVRLDGGEEKTIPAFCEQTLLTYPQGPYVARVAADSATRIWCTAKEYEAGRTALLHVVAQRPHTEAAVAALLAVGELYLAEADLQTAERTWDNALVDLANRETAAYGAIAQRLSSLRYEMAQTAREQGRNADAARLLAQVVNESRFPGDREKAVQELAQAYEHSDQLIFARAAYDHLTRTAHDTHGRLWARYRVAVLDCRLGHATEARAAFESILRERPEDEGLAAACMAGLAFSAITSRVH